MNYTAMIQNRKSVRAFTEKRVPFPAAQEILAYYKNSAKRLVPQLETELHLFGDDVKAPLEGAAGYNQFLVGAPQYLVLLSAKDALAGYNAGYIMEDLILKLTEMGLDSCWLTFTDSEAVKNSLGMESPLEVAAIVAFGYGEKTNRRLRLNIRSMSNVDVVAQHRYMEPKRTISGMVYVNKWGNTIGLEDRIGFFDEMLWESLYAVTQAPSYLNRQAYGFVLHNGGISLVRCPDAYTPDIDAHLSLGIAMLHFGAVAEKWVGALNWNFGPQAAKLDVPEGCEVVATAVL